MAAERAMSAHEVTICECDHGRGKHRYVPGFYDVRGHHEQCDVVGCACVKFVASGRPREEGKQ